MSNKRIFYASHAVAFAANDPNGSQSSYLTTLQGGQSISINTNWGTEQLFQLGRLAVYDQVYTVPEVEVTINKALDGFPTLFRLATGVNTGAGPGGAGQTNHSLIGDANKRTTIVVGVGDETAQVVDDQFAEYTSINMTGMYFENITYTFPVQGIFTEEITFRGYHKSANGDIDGPVNKDPKTGDLLYRQNVKLSDASTVLPPPVSGKCLTNITISANVTRDAMYCLGEFYPYHRYINFPLEITTTFETMPSGATTDSSLLFNANASSQCSGIQLAEVPINIVLCDSSGNVAYSFDLGSGCKLTGHTYSGGDTGGGNVTETFTYTSYNELIVRDYSGLNTTLTKPYGEQQVLSGYPVDGHTNKELGFE
jgi:hypothetical protein